MKKLLSLVFAVAIVVGGVWATNAFFSDEEKSEGNTFQAGAIDLKVDSQQHYNNAVCVEGKWELESGATATVPQYPVIGSECTGTWGQTPEGKDIVGEKFFNFTDVKPGDSGENTVSLHVVNNDAWVCAEVSNLTNADNGLTEPEGKVDATDGAGNGELQNKLMFTIWKDDGDNIQQDTEPTLLSGYPVNGVLPVFDSTTGTPLAGGSTTYLGVKWELPSATGNEVQTDIMTGDITFRVEQARNNPGFRCIPIPTATVTTFEGWSDVDRLPDQDGLSGKWEWLSKVRNNNGGFEMQIGTSDSVPAQQNTADTTWVAGQTESFTLTYNGAGQATLSVANHPSVTFTVGAGTFHRIGINAKAFNGETTLVDDLVLSTVAPLSTDTVSATGAGGNKENSVTIDSGTLSGAWTLTGTFSYSALPGPSDEYPAVQFSID